MTGDKRRYRIATQRRPYGPHELGTSDLAGHPGMGRVWPAGIDRVARSTSCSKSESPRRSNRRSRWGRPRRAVRRPAGSVVAGRTVVRTGAGTPPGTCPRRLQRRPGGRVHALVGEGNVQVAGRATHPDPVRDDDVDQRPGRWGGQAGENSMSGSRWLMVISTSFLPRTVKRPD